MKKKVLSIALAAALGATMFAGCGNSSSSSSAASSAAEASSASSAAEASSASSASSAASGELTGEGKKVTGLFFSLEGEYFTMLDDMLREGLEAKGYTYESQSSNMDSVTQIEQIENATAAGTTAIWIWAIDGNQVADAVKAAVENGVIVYSFVQDPGGNATMVRGTDEVTCGTTLAEMAIEWADGAYGEDAEAGSIKTVFITNENSNEQKTRCDTAKEVIEEDGRFDLMECPINDGTTVNAQSLTENMFAKYPEIDCIICSGGEDVLGVCAYLASDSCVIDDPAESTGVIGVEVNSELADYMRDGYYDAAAVNGGNIVENIATQVEELDQLINGQIEGGFSAVDIGRCTVDDLESYGY